MARPILPSARAIGLRPGERVSGHQEADPPGGARHTSRKKAQAMMLPACEPQLPLSEQGTRPPNLQLGAGCPSARLPPRDRGLRLGRIPGSSEVIPDAAIVCAFAQTVISSS